MGVNEGQIIDGVQKIEFSVWGDFAEYIRSKVKQKLNFIWRGQRNSEKKLKPSLDRLLEDNNLIMPQAIARTIQLNYFKFAIRGRLGIYPPDFEDPNLHKELLALGQHHGLATPLLDWTESPFVATFFATFFAYEKMNKNTGDLKRIVFALDASIITSKLEDTDSAFFMNKGLKEYAAEEDKEPVIEIYKPLSHFNPNLVSQQGLFTVFYFSGIDLEEWVKKVFKDENIPVLSKYYLPDHGREQFLIFLNRMNINHLTLFPDLGGGASQFCNQKIKITNY